MQVPGVVLLAFAVCGGAVAAQQPAGPPQPSSPTQTARPGAPAPAGQATPTRDGRGQAQAKGTAILRGYVVAADTGNPVRRAMVRVFGTGGGSSGSSLTSTDSEGRFELKEMPAGSYTITVMKPGYVQATYGQRNPDQMGRPLDVLDGQIVEKIGFSLSRGGVVTGRVTDDFGDPVAGVQVSAMRFRYVGGTRRMFPAGSGTTDDLGNYRLFGLAPGDYYVSGLMRSQMMGMMSSPGASANDVEGFAPTYYPGTTSPGQGTRITVRATQEVQNISFALSATRLTTISGRVVSSTNEPVVQAQVMVRPADPNDSMGMMVFNGAITRGDGGFQLGGMTPGNYVLQVSPRNAADGISEFGRLRVTVGNDNVDNIFVVTSRGAVLSGTITTDDGTSLPARPDQVNIFARPTDPEMQLGPMNGSPKVNGDWTFEIPGLSDKRVLMASIMEAPDWSLKAVLHNGTDVTDTGIEFVPGQTVDGVQVVFTRKRTEITGSVIGPNGKPDPEVTVVAFAQDSRYWTLASRHLRTARLNQDGRYTLRGLPPEEYFIVAVREFEPGRLQDPEFLESLRDSAIRLTLGEGETRSQDLRSVQR